MTTEKLVDICLNTKGAASDVATVGYRILKDKYRYIGDNTWEYLDTDGTSWILDNNRSRIEMAVKVDVCQTFMERALFWQDESLNTNIPERIDCQIRSQRLLQICLKLGKDKFVRDVVKELRAFLTHDLVI